MANLNTLKTNLETEVTTLSLQASETQANLEEFDVTLESGVLATNIAVKLTALESTYAPELLSVKQQLAEAATKAELATKRSITTLITDTDISDTLRSQIAGTAAINAVPSEASVTPLKTTFFKRDTNLFNKLTRSVDYYVNEANGLLVSSVGFHTSDFIFIKASTSYFASKIWRYAFYDTNKVFISGANPGNTPYGMSITTPANAKYLRFTYYGDFADVIMLSEGSSAVPYEAYIEYFDVDALKDTSIPWDKLSDGKIINVNEATFVKLGKNLFDKTTATTGYYVNNTNGTLAANAQFVVSDFIPVSPSTNYTENSAYYLAYYDSNKVYISGLASAGPVSRTVTTPENAAFVRVSLVLTNLDIFQFELGSLVTSYEPYCYKFTRDLDTTIPDLILPPSIPALVGKEVNIYFDNLMMVDSSKYQINVVCSIGTQQNERWTCVPLAAGTFSLTVEIYENFGLVTSATTNVVVKASSVGTGVTKTLLAIGDSTTAAGVYTQELLTLMSTDPMDVNLIGSIGTAPNLHEGRSGWTTSKFYSDVTSPFVFSGVFNFPQYMTTKGFAAPDYVSIHLGINDVFQWTNDVDLTGVIKDTMSQLENMITSILSYNGTVKVAVFVTIPPSANQDAFGTSYTSGQTRWRYKRNVILFAKKLISQFKDREASRIYLVPVNVNLDTKNNMSTETVVVNSRNSATVVRQNNGVHPANSGYFQMADIWYYWLKSQEV